MIEPIHFFSEQLRSWRRRKKINMEIKIDKVYEGWMVVVRNLKLKKKTCLTINLVHLFMEGKVTNSIFCTSYILY